MLMSMLILVGAVLLLAFTMYAVVFALCWFLNWTLRG